MSDRIDGLLADLDAVAGQTSEERSRSAQRADGFRGATQEEITELLTRLLAWRSPSEPAEDALVNVALQQVLLRQRGAVRGVEALLLDDRVLQLAAELYGQWGPDVTARGHLLCLLTGSRRPAALRCFAETIVADPPRDEVWVGPVFAPLFQHRDYQPSDVFPRLLEAVAHPVTAAAVLDLANFVTREKMVSEHPASARREQLMTLLAGLVGRLGQLESSPPADSAALRKVNQQVNESVALGVALCDALAMIGDTAAVGKLYQTMDLNHRRLRTEAAGALARLGEKAGEDALVELAAEPVARLRVLAYAAELGIEKRIDEQFRSDEARAEAELVLWLSQPSQVGVPPSQCELVERRRLSWPGFAEPVTCFLFRFVYALGEAGFSNIAIAGPITHAFAADLSDLPPADIYAAFAGWHVVHEEIFELAPEDWDDSQRYQVVPQLERCFRDRGLDAIQPVR